MAVSAAPKHPVHPRERGEHLWRTRLLQCTGGSSPRARGTRGRRLQNGQPARFIPASAGNTDSQAFDDRQDAVHPRERGEHPIQSAPAMATGGSSPRARGTRPLHLHRRPDSRFIPASAGNTFNINNRLRSHSVHPRERGEHAGAGDEGGELGGSSPRARGTHAVDPHLQRPDRFIPASAGNTASAMSRSIAVTVHPRERGEHIRSSVIASRRAGSSPRARGTPTDTEGN